MQTERENANELCAGEHGARGLQYVCDHKLKLQFKSVTIDKVGLTLDVRYSHI